MVRELCKSSMATKPQPPKDASLLFGAQSEQAVFDSGADCGCAPRLTLKNVNRVSWFTDRPYRETGSWKPSRLVRQWDSLYEGGEPNAIAGFSVGNVGQMVAFEMHKPRWNKRTESLSFKLRPLDSIQRDAITGLNKVDLADISIFIDDSSGSQPPWYPNGSNMNFTGVNFSGMNLSNANMENTNLNGVNFTNTNLTGTSLFQASGSNIVGQYANFTNADLWTAVFESSDFTGAIFTSADAPDSSFQNSNLTSANFYGADLSQTNFQGANLTGANLNTANIGGAQFYGAIWGNTICPNGTTNSGTSPCSGALPYG